MQAVNARHNDRDDVETCYRSGNGDGFARVFEQAEELPLTGLFRIKVHFRSL